MKKRLICTLVACLCLLALSAQAAEKKGASKAAEVKAAAGEEKAPTGDRSVLKTDKDKISYMIGFQIGSQMKRSNIKIAPSVFTQALQDALEGKMPALTQEEAKAAMENMQKERDQEAQEAQKKGDAYLEANKKKEGVKVTPSGLQYKVIKQGTGANAKDGEMVTVNYKGTLIDGKEFDNSYKRGKPAEFAVGQLVEGWNEALKMMNKGSKWELYIPAKLGYGERGPGDIGPNQVLIFEMELLDIKPAPPAPAGGMPGMPGMQGMPGGARPGAPMPPRER